MENVPQVLTAPEWPSLVGRLEAMGYRSKWNKLDSSDFGSAQKRVRAFMVSRLGQEPPDLPTSAPNAPQLCLRDIMEPERAERYVRRIPLDRVKWRTPKENYRHPQSEGIECHLMDAGDTRLESRRIASEDSLCPALRTGCPQKTVEEEEEERVRPLVGTADNLRMAPRGRKAIGTIKDGEERLVVAPSDSAGESTPTAEDARESFYSRRMLYSSSSSSPTVRTFHGLKDTIKVVDDRPGSSTPCASIEGETFYTKAMLYSPSSSSPTIRCEGRHGLSNQPKVVGSEDDMNLVVSVLTPRECWRLMGFPEWAYMRASRVSSETQLYNQAGNSIVVEVLIAIFNAMFRPKKYIVQKRITEAVA